MSTPSSKENSSKELLKQLPRKQSAVRSSQHSIFVLIDEQCASKRGEPVDSADDERVLQELRNKMDRRPGLKAHLRPLKFRIDHYAGTVEYDISGFLKKNLDELSSNITRLLSNCSFKRLAELSRDDAERMKEVQQEQKKARGGLARKTVFTTFRESLNSLLKTLVDRKQNWVRCVKPNQDQQPNFFNEKFVKSQLAYSGTLELANVRKSGFQTRKELARVWDFYNICLEEFGRGDGASRGLSRSDPRRVEMRQQSVPERVKGMLALLESALRVDASHYRVGRTLLFMKEGMLSSLDRLREVSLRHAGLRRAGLLVICLRRAYYFLFESALQRALEHALSKRLAPNRKLLTLLGTFKQSPAGKRCFGSQGFSDAFEQASALHGVQGAEEDDEVVDIVEGADAWRASIFGELPIPVNWRDILQRHAQALPTTAVSAVGREVGNTLLELNTRLLEGIASASASVATAGSPAAGLLQILSGVQLELAKVTSGLVDTVGERELAQKKKKAEQEEKETLEALESANAALLAIDMPTDDQLAAFTGVLDEALSTRVAGSSNTAAFDAAVETGRGTLESARKQLAIARTSELQVAAVEEHAKGSGTRFFFLVADKLRECESTDTTPLPCLQELQAHHPDWLVEKSFDLGMAITHEYRDNFAAVSHRSAHIAMHPRVPPNVQQTGAIACFPRLHNVPQYCACRWETPGQPDPTGVQKQAIRDMLLERPQVKYVWMEYAMPIRARADNARRHFGVCGLQG